MAEGDYPLFDGRRPTLLPQFDVPQVASNGVVGLQQPSQMLAANPRVNATATLTVGGTITNNDAVNITFSSKVFGVPGSSAAATVVVGPVPIVTGDTVSTVAEKIARACNDNLTLKNYGVLADVSAAGVVTFSWPGPVGNFCTVSGAVTGSATETLTFANAGVLSGGSGPVIPVSNFSFTWNSATFAFWAYQPEVVGYDCITAMVAQGMPLS